ncbi:site-specific integrase, partial [Flavobacterium sp. UBA4854]
MKTNKEAFSDYLLLEKKYSVHTVGAYLNDIVSFGSFVKESFDQESIDLVNYSQVRSWIVFLVD